MPSTIWYISKYVTPPYAAKVGARGFLLLREFARAGHCAVLITSDSNHLASPPKLTGPRLKEAIDGVDVHWLRTWKYRGALSIGRMISWLDFEWQLWRMPKSDLPRPDVVIVSSLSLLTVLNGLWLRRKYGCKLVFEVRDIWPLTLVEVGRLSSWNPFVVFLGWIERLGYRRADMIVGTMPNLVEHVSKVTKSHRPVICVPQGIDPTLLLPPQVVPKDFVEQYIPREKFIVCYAGSIGTANALDTLLACARELNDRRDIHFIVVGEGDLKSRFQKESSDLGNVSFPPAVPKAAVADLLGRTDLLYFAFHKASRLRFGQSLNKVIDYMLSGKPIVASYTGFPSMINEADCGSFVPAEDVSALRAEIERYADMPAEARARIGERGRDWIMKNRRFETVAADYLRNIGLESAAPETSEGVAHQPSTSAN
ncbi:RfaG Glycosyltransferase [Paracoccaceae bacterium]